MAAKELAKMVKDERTPVYFADAEMSDVILVMEDREFHVHKMVLASRSKYFKALFYADFKEKDQKKIEINEVNPVAFERMLELIYNGSIKGSYVFDTCPGVIENHFWNQANALWTVLDRFDCDHGKDLFVKLIQSSLCAEEREYYTYKNHKDVYRCFGCADRFIFAAKHGIQFPKCSYFGITNWINKNPNLPDDLPDAKKIFAKIHDNRL